MIAPLAKWMDRLFMQKNCRRAPSFDIQTLRREAIRFLNGPDFIPAESQPARVEFSRDQPELSFSVPMPRPSSFAENNFDHGRFYPYAEHWQEGPAIILHPFSLSVSSRQPEAWAEASGRKR